MGVGSQSLSFKPKLHNQLMENLGKATWTNVLQDVLHLLPYLSKGERWEQVIHGYCKKYVLLFNKKIITKKKF